MSAARGGGPGATRTPWQRARAAARWLRSPEVRADWRAERRRRRGGEPPLPAGVRRVVVVCHGNLCRSPFAAAALAAARPELEVRSAGLHAATGHPAEPAAVRVAAGLGVDLSAHRTQRVTPELLEGTDLVLGFTGRHAEALVREHGVAPGRVRLVGDYLAQPPFGIEDPWGREDEVFAEVYERILLSVKRIGELLDMQQADRASEADGTGRGMASGAVAGDRASDAAEARASRGWSGDA